MLNRIRATLVPALMEGAGVFLVALFGSQLLFAPEVQWIGFAATLIPALAFGAATVAFRAGHAA